MTIDWNKWHNILIESVEAFELDSAVDLARRLKLQWSGTDEDPVSAGSLLEVIYKVCTDLIEKYESNWQYDETEHLENNTYYDDAGILTEEVNMYLLEDNPEIISPKLIIKLRKDEQDKYWFEIYIEAVGQMF